MIPIWPKNMETFQFDCYVGGGQTARAFWLFKLNVFKFPNLINPCLLNNFSSATSSSLYCLFVNATNHSTNLIYALSSTFPLNFAATLLSQITVRHPLHPTWTLFCNSLPQSSYFCTVNPKYLKPCTFVTSPFLASLFYLPLSHSHMYSVLLRMTFIPLSFYLFKFSSTWFLFSPPGTHRGELEDL